MRRKRPSPTPPLSAPHSEGIDQAIAETNSHRFFTPGWAATALLGLIMLVGVLLPASLKIHHLVAISYTEDEQRQAILPEAAQDAHVFHSLLIPSENTAGIDTIVSARRALAHGEWRTRVNPLENYPAGRDVFTAPCHAWYLATLARIEQLFYTTRATLAVEHAALVAEPLLQIVALLCGASLLRARQASSQTLLGYAGISVLYPICATFVPGSPDPACLFLVATHLSSLALVLALRDVEAGLDGPAPKKLTLLILSGLLSGFALWIKPSAQSFIIVGCITALCACVASSIREEELMLRALGHIRVWIASLAGAALTFYLLDAAPDRLTSWEIRALHPLHALSLVGYFETLCCLCHTVAANRKTSLVKIAPRLLGSVAGAAALPCAMLYWRNPGILFSDLSDYSLIRPSEGISAPNLFQWLAAEELSLSKLTIITVALGAMLATASLVAYARGQGQRLAVASLVGSMWICAALAYWRLNWWVTFAYFIPILVVLFEPQRAGSREALGPTKRLALLFLVPGVLTSAVATLLFQFSHRATGEQGWESRSTAERSLARWVSLGHASHETPVVHSSPNMTKAFGYYAGIAGLGTTNWENRDGVSVATRIALSVSRTEVQALISKRAITHVILPSWDPILQSYIWAQERKGRSPVYSSLLRWPPPTWLRPIPYRVIDPTSQQEMPCMVFQVEDGQSAIEAACRLTEYFIEIGLIEAAQKSAQLLKKYPLDRGCRLLQAELAAVAGDSAGFNELLPEVVKMADSRAANALPFWQRVALCSLLSRTSHAALSARVFQTSVFPMAVDGWRELTPLARYRLLVMWRSHSELGEKNRDQRLLILTSLPAPLQDAYSSAFPSL